MAKRYGVLFDDYWTGLSARAIRRRGGKDATILSLYLIANRHANMLGLYRLLDDDVKFEVSLGVARIRKAYGALADAEFAAHDDRSGFVWVYQMARIRLNLEPGQPLDPDDKRVLHINRIYTALDANPFLGPFFDANHRTLRLKKRREGGSLVDPQPSTHHMSGLPRGSEGASKPVTEIRDQGSEIRDQRKAQRLAAREAVKHADENRGVIGALVFDLVRTAPAGTSFADLKELAKDACAQHRIAYDGATVSQALEEALARKAKAS